MIFLRYYNTIRHLKVKQICYQLWYKQRRKVRKYSGFSYDFSKVAPQAISSGFVNFIKNNEAYFGQNQFEFLNQRVDFKGNIDWDYNHFGKLWTYNLNYFEFLHQHNAKTYRADFENIINEFIDKLPNLKNANEPFPISLRIINWIKYFIENKHTQQISWNNSLYAQLFILEDQLEYHLMGNHLLENAFAMVMGGVYFNDNVFYQKGSRLLTQQLKEQILDDGAHFELSPMYHSLMLYRLLDCIQLLEQKSVKLDTQSTLLILKQYAVKMLGWLLAIKYESNALPLFNDATYKVAPEPNDLLTYGDFLAIKYFPMTLRASGYRRFKTNVFDVVVKTELTKASYIPGHAHADNFTFECNIFNQPIVVDPGISTYEKNEIRQGQRSTLNHNTIVVKQQNSSDVWGGFRVGKRAETRLLIDDPNVLHVHHNGYNTPVERNFELNQNIFSIEDKVMGNAEAYLHFHPTVKPILQNDTVEIENLLIQFIGATEITIFDYQYCVGYNKTITAKKLGVRFQDNLKTIIKA